MNWVPLLLASRHSARHAQATDVWIEFGYVLNYQGNDLCSSELIVAQMVSVVEIIIGMLLFFFFSEQSFFSNGFRCSNWKVMEKISRF
jgi:hypothetical protein